MARGFEREMRVQRVAHPLTGCSRPGRRVAPVFDGLSADATAGETSGPDLAAALARERAARARVDLAARRAAFLADASSVLVASLDWERTLQSLARLAVGYLADWCVVHVPGPEGTQHHVTVAHVDPALEPLVRLATTFEPEWDGVARVLRTGQPRLYPVIPAPDDGAAPTPAQAAMMRTLAPRSAIVVPLVGRGRVRGAVSLMSSDPARTYGAADLELAEDLARQASLAVENAELYREAQQANRLKDEFLSIVSHELRTPLTAIFAWARLLQTRRLEPAKAARAIATIERNARAQARVIDDLLDVSRITSGTLRLHLRPLELGPLVDAAFGAVRAAADAKQIDLVASVPPGPHVVLGDPDRLQQIVVHILANAIGFTPSGRVAVELRRDGGQIHLAVTDTGIGMTAAFLPRAFESFAQADCSATRPHNGLGLGLTLVRHLVELHGGSVRAESAGEGHGTTVTVTLPVHTGGAVEAPATAPRRRRAEAGDETDLDGLHVLVVDDDADGRESVAMVLEASGARVTAVASAREALDAFAAGTPDMVISDLAMPGEDGFALIRRIRQLSIEQGGGVPAIALTACAEAAAGPNAIRAGYQLHVAKPYEPADLVAAVAQFARPASTASDAAGF